jgi:hypothetical protein
MESIVHASPGVEHLATALDAAGRNNLDGIRDGNTPSRCAAADFRDPSFCSVGTMLKYFDKTASSTRSESRYVPRNCGTLSATARKNRKIDD